MEKRSHNAYVMRLIKGEKTSISLLWFRTGVIITVTFEEVYDTPQRNTAADKADNALEYGAGSSDEGRGIDLAGAAANA